MILQALYNSEINASVSTFWDGGFEAKLGDESNGFVAETNVDTWHQAKMWFTLMACDYYPDSQFAKGVPAPMLDASRAWWEAEQATRRNRLAKFEATRS